MRANVVFYGLLATLLTPFAVAWMATALMQHNYWTPSIIAHGIVYSPCVNLEQPLAQPFQWTLFVITSHPESEALKKWYALPKFFPKTPLSVEPLDPASLSLSARTLLEAQMSHPIKTEGTLLLVDPQGFVAMSFDPSIVVQDVLIDLKKILPKHRPPVRNAS